ncbi:MAG: polysaccharide deacetylase family protein [Acidobacteriota bacterium]
MKPRRLAAMGVALAAKATGYLAWWNRRRHRRGDFRVFILEYHDVAEGGGEKEGTVSRRRFRRHLRWLSKRYRFTTVAQAAEALRRGDLTEDLMVVTFDDGYAGNADAAFPVLQEVGVPATIYLTTGFLDGEGLWFDIARRCLDAAGGAAAAEVGPDLRERLVGTLGAWPPERSIDSQIRQLKALPAAVREAAVEDLRAAGLDTGTPARPMTWDQARQLRDAGIELGAHTHSHPILSRLDAEGQEREIIRSRERITEELGEEPVTFAMPNGSEQDYDHATLDILRRLGFAAACTTRRGANVPGEDLLQLRRLGIGADPLPLLEARLAGLFDEGLRRQLPFT